MYGSSITFADFICLALLAAFVFSAVLILRVWKKDLSPYRRILFTFIILSVLALACTSVYYVFSEAISILELRHD